MSAMAYLYPLAGGLLIGVSAAMYLLFNGRIAGISGLAASAIGLVDRVPRLLPGVFLLGLLCGAAFASQWFSVNHLKVTSSVTLLLIGGVLVGYGTRLGSGCTSGHGVCGLARFSSRSLMATLVFMLIAAITVYLLRHVLGVGA
jgi:uncharacterized protein